MRQLLFTALEAGIASSILIPLFLWLNRVRFRDGKRTLLCLIFAIYLSGVYAVVGLPNVLYLRLDVNLNLVPFRHLLASPAQAVLNVLLFVPLGFFLTLLWRRFRRLPEVLLTGFFLSLTIELAQIFTFRATDVNDLITNTLGALAGWGVGRMAVRLFPSMPGKHARKDLAVIGGSVLFVMFFVHPFLSGLVWSVFL